MVELGELITSSKDKVCSSLKYSKASKFTTTEHQVNLPAFSFIAKNPKLLKFNCDFSPPALLTLNLNLAIMSFDDPLADGQNNR